MHVLKRAAPIVTILPQIGDDGAEFGDQGVGGDAYGIQWCVSRHVKGVAVGARRRRENPMKLGRLDVPHPERSSFVPEIRPARTARRTVDLSKPHATAASARVYGMVVRLAAA